MANGVADKTPLAWKLRLRRIAWRLARLLLICYTVVLILGYMMQEKLVFPGAGTQGTAEAQVTAPADSRLIELKTKEGKNVMALFGPALLANGAPNPNAQTCPTLLYFYGNGMCLSATTWEFQEFRQLGANVMIPEYVGYGLSEGNPSEAGCYATADAAYAWLLDQKNVDKTKIIPAGWSLGAAVACDLASRHMSDGPGGGPAVAGLVMFSAFTSMDAVAHHHYPFLPVSLILRHHFRSIDKIPGIRVPLLLGHGRGDTLVPFAMSAELKAQAKSSPQVEYMPVDGAEHNDFYLVGQTEILRKLGDLVRRVGAEKVKEKS